MPPKTISVPLKIVRSGLRYDDLSPEEKDQWDMLEWGEDDVPDTIEAAEVNKRLFNEETVDLVIAHLMQNGLKVEGGDRLGKTILFAKNEAHAKFIEKRFNLAYPALTGHFARVITHQTGAYAQTLIDDFSAKAKAPISRSPSICSIPASMCPKSSTSSSSNRYVPRRNSGR